jgi:hypothetical protein
VAAGPDIVSGIVGNKVCKCEGESIGEFPAVFDSRLIAARVRLAEIRDSVL